MDWEQLLAVGRLGDNNQRKELHDRTAFERDFDRIIFSPAFRRLQNKTQVFPLPETDFIHTRLTHSLETSSIGRSLGKMAGEKIIAAEIGNPFFEMSGIKASDFASIVAAASLAHDIGNPPFGHSGEDAISDYFCSEKGIQWLVGMSKKECGDFQNFEGNALGFRKLAFTYPLQSEVKGGLQLSLATLGAFTKYPKESYPKSQDATLVSEKKYGFFQAEREIFKELAGELGLVNSGNEIDYKWKRHPLALLMEAADDICYRIIDLEDGYNLGIISFEETEELLSYKEIENNNRYSLIRDKSEKIGYLRAKTIYRLVVECAEVFEYKYNDIMSGAFDASLIKSTPSSVQCEKIINLSREKIYSSSQVLEIEAAGFEVIGGLIDTFLDAAFNNGNTKKNKKIFSLLPSHLLADKDTENHTYQQVLNITDFVAGMTDVAAISLFRKIKGISLPNMR
jgi:dGTPase